MPRQNRVSPFGDLIRTPARGAFMGNRGCLHNDQGEIVRRAQTKRWITCRLAFKGRRRPLMQTGRYTELFFLDEATAFAAGHRPCAECRRQDYNHFRALWLETVGASRKGIAPSAEDIDQRLQLARVDATGGQRTYKARLDSLPEGTMIFLDDPGQPCLVLGARLYPWRPDDYGKSIPRSSGNNVTVLTPRPVVAIFAGGYQPQIDASALKQ